MNNIELKISNDTIQVLFNKHLKLKDNSQIMFSAPFGSGKTTFLKDYFSENEEYKVVHLFPINYATANNDDIFELVKYDIFYELITNKVDDIKLKDEEFSMLLTSQNFILHDINIIELFKTIIKTTSKIGKSSVEIAEALNDVISDYGKKHKSLQINELEQIKKYLEGKSKVQGSIIEFDEYSQLLEDLLKRSKDDNEKLKETVLIIDDLDRMDPEHIFRLFNVFSAHYDLRLNRNKFGFDKVIFVCDISNIRKIFQHRYGQEVDFSGYIDKFYSVEIFEFDNRRFLIDKVETILSRIEIVPNDYDGIYSLKKRSTFYTQVSYFIIALIVGKQTNLRSVINIDGFDLPDYSFNTENSYEGHFCRNWDFLIIVDFLKQIVGDIEILDKKLKFLAENMDAKNVSPAIKASELKYMFDACLPFLDLRPFGEDKKGDTPYEYYDDEQKIRLFYTMQSGRFRFIPMPRISRTENQQGEDHQLNFFKFFYKAFLSCRNRNIIK